MLEFNIINHHRWEFFFVFFLIKYQNRVQRGQKRVSSLSLSVPPSLNSSTACCFLLLLLWDYFPRRGRGGEPESAGRRGEKVQKGAP